MAAKVIAHNVTDFHKTDKGQRFQQEQRNAQRLNVMTTPEEIADYIARNVFLKPFIDISREHRGVLYGIKLTWDRTMQQLFFRHAIMPSLRMQMAILPGDGGREVVSITAATQLDPDKNGGKPDPAFTPMIQACLDHLAHEQQIDQLVKTTGIPLTAAREVVTVPWMPFMARQIAGCHKLSIRTAAKADKPDPSVYSCGESCTLDIVHADAKHVVWRNYLRNGVYSGSRIFHKMNRYDLQRFRDSAQSHQLHNVMIDVFDDCSRTLRVAGSEVVQNKPWALDLLHQTRRYSNWLGLFVPNRPADAPDTLYFELQSPASQQMGLVVDRKGKVDVTTRGYPLAPIHEIRARARSIPRHYPLPKTYP